MSNFLIFNLFFERFVSVCDAIGGLDLRDIFATPAT